LVVRLPKSTASIWFRFFRAGTLFRNCQPISFFGSGLAWLDGARNFTDSDGCHRRSSKPRAKLVEVTKKGRKTLEKLGKFPSDVSTTSALSPSPPKIKTIAAPCFNAPKHRSAAFRANSSGPGDDWQSVRAGAVKKFVAGRKPTSQNGAIPAKTQ
jgi:hypothetical protein